MKLSPTQWTATIVLLVILGAGYAGIRHIEAGVEASQRRLVAYESALSHWSRSVVAAPPPAAGDRGWHGYAQMLSAQAQAAPKLPNLYRVPFIGYVGPWRTYTATLWANKVQAQLAVGNQAVELARTGIAHEAQVVTALDTLMDYPATQDLQSSTASELDARVLADVNGLQAATTKLGALETKYDPDVTLIESQVGSVRLAFRHLLSSLGTPGQMTAMAAAIMSLHNAQNSIYANRTKYTSALNSQLLQVRADGDNLAASTRGMTN